MSPAVTPGTIPGPPAEPIGKPAKKSATVTSVTPTLLTRSPRWTRGLDVGPT